MTDGYVKNAQDLLSQGRILDCVSILKNNLSDKDILQEILQLEIRFNSLNRKINAGTIEFEDAQLEENRISNSLLFILTNLARSGGIKKVENNISKKRKFDYKWIIIAVLSILILATGYYIVSKKKGVVSDPCARITCMNGGECIDGACKCPDGFSGRRCQTKIESTVMKVTNVKLSATPEEFAGKCPVKIKFDGAITANGRGIVTYRFVRSDGVKGGEKKLTFRSAGTQRISNVWELGAAGRDYGRLWQMVEVISPNKINSEAGATRVKCDDDQVAQGNWIIKATLKADPASFRGTCPKTINFSGNISVRGGSGKVAYRFLRSDGAKGPIKTLNFTEPGSKTVRTSWKLGAQGRLYEDYWQKIIILEPAPSESNMAKFTLKCI